MISPYHFKLYKLSRRNNVIPTASQLYSNYHRPAGYLLRSRESTNYTNSDASLIAKPSSSQSKEAIEQICGKSIFIQELLKRDYKGDTAIHAAAKSGSIEMLNFLMGSCTQGFLEI